MPVYGLIGKTLKHSFSKSFFEKYFHELGVIDHRYTNYECQTIEDIKQVLNKNEIQGLNITIPYKKDIIPLLDGLTDIASQIGAVNVIKKEGKKWLGHNTDGPAFMESLEQFLPKNFNSKALILGNGGAAQAVKWGLEAQNIEFKSVCRTGNFTYNDLTDKVLADFHLIINTTPLGQYPEIGISPKIPFSAINQDFYLYDLIYNPEKTLFLELGKNHNARIKNGLDMLHKQALKSWTFWNQI